MLENRPLISQIYLTILRTDERMRGIAARKTILQDHHLTNACLLLLTYTKCVAVEELEVVKSQEGNFNEVKAMTANLVKDIGKDRNLAVDVAFASVCCSCP